MFYNIFCSDHDVLQHFVQGAWCSTTFFAGTMMFYNILCRDHDVLQPFVQGPWCSTTFCAGTIMFYNILCRDHDVLEHFVQGPWCSTIFCTGTMMFYNILCRDYDVIQDFVQGPWCSTVFCAGTMMWRRCPPVCWRQPAPGTSCPSSILLESSLPGIFSWPNPASWNYKIRCLRLWVMIRNVLFNYTFCAHLWDALLFSQIMSLAKYEGKKDVVKSQCRKAFCISDKIFYLWEYCMYL